MYKNYPNNIDFIIIIKSMLTMNIQCDFFDVLTPPF